MLRRFFVFACCLLSLAAPACADDYAAPTLPNLARALVRFHAVDLNDSGLLDEYSIVVDCDLYRAFYHNDFKWQQVRQAELSSVQGDIATFPTGFAYDTVLHLDRYDFTARLFRFTAASALHNINSLELYAGDGTVCGDVKLADLPHVYHAVLAAPIYMDGLPLGEKDAQALLAAMSAGGDADRAVYARFDVRIVYIEPLRKFATQVGADIVTHYGQTDAFSGSARLDARLESITFYEDPQHTRLIYRYQM